MKAITSKNKQTAINKFEKFVITNVKKKNVKGGSDPIIIQDMSNL